MKKKIFSILFALVLVLTLSLVTAVPVAAADLHVGSGQTYATIQAAVDAANPGDTIIVHAGTYAGFKVLSTSNLTITNSGTDNPVVSGTTVTVNTTNALIGVESSTNITIEGLTVDATGLTSVPLAAIFYYHSSGTIKDSTVQDIEDLGQQAGAIWVHGNGTESISVLSNTITEFNKGGIWAKDVSSVRIEGNTISTTNDSLAPNGIQVGYVGATTGTTGTVKNNVVSGCQWSGYNPGLGYEASGNWTGSGILPIDTASDLTISGNEVRDCDVGMDIELGSSSIVTKNDVHDNSYGFVLWNANTVINFNNIYDNALYGVYRTNVLTDSVDAENNWWGAADGPTASPGSGDRVSSNVDYTPWLTAPVGGATVGMTVDNPQIVAISVTPTSIDFGTLYPGDTSAETTITVENIGTVVVNVDISIAEMGTFFIDNLYLAGTGTGGTKAADYSITGLTVGETKYDPPHAYVVVPPGYEAVGTVTGTLVFEATP